MAGICCRRCRAGLAVPAGMSASTAAQILVNPLTAGTLTGGELMFDRVNGSETRPVQLWPVGHPNWGGTSASRP